MSNRNDFANKNTEFTGTDGIVLPRGTTGERPSGAVGQVRFNTELGALENYTEDGWFPVSVPIPTLASVGGTIYAGVTSTLTLTGTNFGTAAGSVRFTASGVVTNVTVTPASATSATVAVPSAVFNLSAGVSVDVQFVNSDNGVSNIIPKTIVALPTGGTITTSGSYRIHTITSSTNFVIPSGLTLDVEYLIVAGGGGGGSRRGGGGGAGGVLTNATGASFSVSAQSYTVVVGAGGIHGTSTRNSAGSTATNGNNSSVFGFTGLGGGRGASFETPGYSANTGGSGGGGCNTTDTTGANGTSGQGTKGGNGNTDDSAYQGGGGGGASQGGFDANDGRGGAGVDLSAYFPNAGTNASNTTTGTLGHFGGGGAGGRYIANTGEFRVGGVGGGGRGQSFNGPGPGATSVMDGLENTGGGGGGGTTNNGLERGGGGGSGIVIIRYIL